MLNKLRTKILSLNYYHKYYSKITVQRLTKYLCLVNDNDYEYFTGFTLLSVQPLKMDMVMPCSKFQGSSASQNDPPNFNASFCIFAANKAD